MYVYRFTVYLNHNREFVNCLSTDIFMWVRRTFT